MQDQHIERLLKCQLWLEEKWRIYEFEIINMTVKSPCYILRRSHQNHIMGNVELIENVDKFFDFGWFGEYIVLCWIDLYTEDFQRILISYKLNVSFERPQRYIVKHQLSRIGKAMIMQVVHYAESHKQCFCGQKSRRTVRNFPDAQAKSELNISRKCLSFDKFMASSPSWIAPRVSLCDRFSDSFGTNRKWPHSMGDTLTIAVPSSSFLLLIVNIFSFSLIFPKWNRWLEKGSAIESN